MPLRWQHIPSLSRFLLTTPPHTRLFASLVMLEAPRRTHGSTEEIVDDSEPERAEIRRRERRAKSKPPTTVCSVPNKSAVTQRTAPDVIINDVIEISDSDSDLNIPHRNIEIQLQSKKIRTVSPPTASGSSHITDSFNVVSLDLRAATEPAKIPSSSNFPIEDEESEVTTTLPHVLDPKLFAYVSSTTSKRPRPSLRTALPSTHARKNAALLAPAPRKPSTFDLSNDELSKVSRCICCEVSWTVRKIGPQKLAHIRSCANKHALNGETVRILLQKEVTGYVTLPKTVGKNKAKEPLPEAGPSSKKTFLEEVVDAAPRKKAKRWQAETVLANVSTTRDSILARAQGILNTPISSASDPTEDDVVMDHPFRPSTLLNALDNDTPPSTQPFARSTLAHLQRPTSTFSLFNMNTSPIRISSTNADISHRYIHTASPELAGVSPPLFEPIITGRSLEEVWEIGQEGQPDKTFRRSRISLDLNNEVISGIIDSGNILGIESSNSRPPSSCSSLDKAFSKMNVESTPKKTPKKSKRIAKPRSPKSTTKKKSVDFGAKWEAHMKTHITQNADLHQRILRYEPIHFEIFLEFAQLYAPLSSKLKLQVQNFLDQQAILTYGRILWSKG